MDVRKPEDIKRIERIVRDALTRDFDNVEILSIGILEDEDTDGEDVLRIDVIFQGASKDVDAKKLSGAVRHVRPKLRAIGEKAFPLFSFISNKDLGSKKLASA